MWHFLQSALFSDEEDSDSDTNEQVKSLDSEEKTRKDVNEYNSSLNKLRGNEANPSSWLSIEELLNEKHNNELPWKSSYHANNNAAHQPKAVPLDKLIQMTPRSAVERHTKSSLSSSRSRAWEPKFVPYEPYKGAITPLQPCLNTSSGKRVNSANAKGIRTSGKDVNETCSPSSKPKLDDIKSENVELSNDDHSSSKVLVALKEELSKCRKELKLQEEVNVEMKKLLVASVGEDMEARMAFLTQDKARLAANIHYFAAKMARDGEEKESLSVEAQLWRSKFLATSVVVEDLARCKATLVHQCEQFEHSIRLLLQEHSAMWENLLQTYRRFFSPKNSTSFTEDEVRGTVKEMTLLNLSEKIQSLSSKLQPRTFSFDDEISTLTHKDTPAEEAFKKLLIEQDSITESDYSTVASAAVSDEAKAHFLKLGDELMSPSKTSFQSCTHCQGSVHNV